MRKKIIFFGMFLVVYLSACHRKIIPENAMPKNGFTETGYASYYSDKLNGKPTANGELYNSTKLTAAHRNIPFGTYVLVTNINNKKSVKVRINDRGPFVAGRIIDLSKAAAKEIDMIGAGIVKVTIVY